MLRRSSLLSELNPEIAAVVSRRLMPREAVLKLITRRLETVRSDALHQASLFESRAQVRTHSRCYAENRVSIRFHESWEVVGVARTLMS